MSRRIDRIPIILEELSKVWLANPDLRLGQLLIAAVKPSSLLRLFQTEDDAMLLRLQEMSDAL